MSDLPAARTGNGSRTKRLVILVGSIAVAGVSVFAATLYQRPAPEPDEPAPGMHYDKNANTISLAPGAMQWAVVKTSLPDPAEQRWSEPLPARVLFDESRTSRLGAPLAGRVSAVYAERGTQVKAGAPLYTVSSPGLAELRSAVKLAQVEKETADKNFARTQDAVASQVLPGKELIQAKQDLAEADLALKLAQQKLSSLKIGAAGDSAAFTVTAPRDGVVVEKTVNVGQTVSPDSGSLMAIADLSTVWVVADITGSHIAGATPGSKVRVVIGNGASSDREAVIDQLSAVVDPDRHAVPVRIKLDNPDGTLRPNAYVQVRLFDPTPTVAMLPAAAVMSDGEKSFVYVENPTGVLKRRDVEVGSVIGGRVPVTAGITAKERVVVQGGILIDGQIDLDN
jgi:membrane fusion protein, heavy metal efflux system